MLEPLIDKSKVGLWIQKEDHFDIWLDVNSLQTAFIQQGRRCHIERTSLCTMAITFDIITLEWNCSFAYHKNSWQMCCGLAWPEPIGFLKKNLVDQTEKFIGLEKIMVKPSPKHNFYCKIYGPSWVGRVLASYGRVQFDPKFHQTYTF